MVVIGNDEPSEHWFDATYPTAKQIRDAHRVMRPSGDLRYKELVQAIYELRPDEGLVITRRVLPEELNARIYRGVRHFEHPDAYEVWHYGQRMRVRSEKDYEQKDGERRRIPSQWTNRLALEEGFDLHRHTEAAISRVLNEKREEEPWTGFEIITPDGRSVYRPITAEIDGEAHAWFLGSMPQKVQEKFKGKKPKISNYGHKSAIDIPSRSATNEVDIRGNTVTLYGHQQVNFRFLPVEGRNKFTYAVNMYVDCTCEFYRKNHMLHERRRKPEQLMCAHAVAAVELDTLHRGDMSTKLINAKANKRDAEEQLRKAPEDQREQLQERVADIQKQIDFYERSPRLIAPVTYRPGPNPTYFKDVMDRKVLIKQDGYEGPLDMIEEEVLLNAAIFEEVRQGHYRHALNSAPRPYLVHFLNDPYAISFSSLQRMDGEAGNKRIDDVYGPEI